MRIEASSSAARPADADYPVLGKQLPAVTLPGQAPDRPLPEGIEPRERRPSPRQVERAVETLNKTSHIFNTNLRFSIHEATHQILVKVIREDTGEVLREIPPEKALDALARMEQALGLLVDERR